MALGAIGDKQAAATKDTADAIKQLLDCVATYPNYGIAYCTSNMVLAYNYYAGLNNEHKGCSRVGGHIFLSDNGPEPRCNGPVLTIDQTIKLVMTSAAEY